MVGFVLFIATGVVACLIGLAFKKWLHNDFVIAMIVSVFSFAAIIYFVTNPLIVNFNKDLNEKYEINDEDYSNLNDDYLIVKGSIKGDELKNNIIKAMEDNIIDNVEYENITGRNVSYLVNSDKKLKYKGSKEKLLNNLNNSAEAIALKVVQSLSSNRVEVIESNTEGNISTFKITTNSKICTVGVKVDKKGLSKVNSMSCNDIDKNKLVDSKLKDLDEYFTPNGKKEINETISKL